MIAIILKFVFIYFLFIFLKSLIKGWFVLKGPIKDFQKMKRNMEENNLYHQRQENSSTVNNENIRNSQTIEAEYRVIKD